MTDASSPRRFVARPRRPSSEAEPKFDSTPELVRAMLDLATDASTVVSLGLEHFDSEDGRLSRHAADAIVLKFQELCDRLPNEVRERHPDVPWELIRGMRNRLGHHYQVTDHLIVWNTIWIHLPAVAGQLAAELD